MTSYPQAIRTDVRSDATWVWVTANDWLDCATWLKEQNFVRCEWLTAAHLGEETFQVTLCVSDEIISEKTVVVTEVQGQVASIEQVYPVAQFHEREMAQMVGLIFENASNVSPAFNAEFSGHPLRRDFALTQRTVQEWPGAVDPEKVTKRRPALAPGVRQEWL